MTGGWAATNTLRETIERGSHKGGHHPRCATGVDEGCDCYARSTRPARDALALVETALDALERISKQQPQTIDWLRANGIIFDGPLGTDPNNWEHVAFSIYNDLCEVDAIAAAALRAVREGK